MVIVGHSNADPDALASMILLSRILENYGVEAIHVCPEGPSKLSRQLLGQVGIEQRCMDSISNPRFYEWVIVVDTSNPAQLGISMEDLEGSKLIVIDHHYPGKLSNNALLKIIERRAASTTEIVAVLAEALDVIVDEKTAFIGVAGIYYDTGRLKRIGIYTIPALDYLVSMGGKPLLLEVEDLPFSERYARIKAASRMKTARICKELILSFTHVGSFESSVARGLIDLGADVAIVVGGGTPTRIAVRTSNRALNNGLTARDLAKYIAERFQGEGGGHPQAAMAHIKSDMPREEIVEILYRSVPGKAARICVGARGNERGKAK
ncbi:MAG: DHH family phosphoesterase [Desulfurococcales archaeon]|nr:DHH family phosphoesterase [Desulfurococcales archaeon]